MEGRGTAPDPGGDRGLDFMDVFALGILLVFFLSLWFVPLLLLETLP